jgi:hypothetical protein
MIVGILTYTYLLMLNQLTLTVLCHLICSNREAGASPRRVKEWSRSRLGELWRIGKDELRLDLGDLKHILVVQASEWCTKDE